MVKSNRRQYTYNLRPGLTMINAEIAIGSGGAPTLTSGVGHGVKSVSRTGAGQLTVNLESAYLGLSGFHASLENDTLVDDYGIQLVGEWLSGVATVNVAEGVADGYVKVGVSDGYGNAFIDPIDHVLWLTLFAKTSEQGQGVTHGE